MQFWHGSCPYHAKMKKIMKRIGILIGWLVWAAGVSAQSWSLDDCMKYAVEHATEVKREVVNAQPAPANAVDFSLGDDRFFTR